ncbi:MAG TPA: RidA family protein, partial [Burkholderiaceae bacterium]|nr:RidA family protein [Burkholderiaceae bacterium]
MSTQVSPVTYLNPEGASQAQGQYSHVGTPDGKLHFIAGQLAVAPDGSIAGVRDFETQFHQVFNNLGAVLKGLGGDYNNVVKFTTYLVHSQDIKEFK